MAKKKQHQGLFEAVSRQGDHSMAVPDWAKRPKDQPEDHPAEPEPDEPQDLTTEEQPTPPQDDEAAAPQEPFTAPPEPEQIDKPTPPEDEDDEQNAPAEEPDYVDELPEDLDEPADEPLPGEPVEEAQPSADELPTFNEAMPTFADQADEPGELIEPYQAGRTIALRFTTAMILLGAAGVLIVAAFVLGRLTAPTGPTQADPASQANTPDKRPDLTGKQTGPVLEGGVICKENQQSDQYHYLVIQTLNGSSDADYTEAYRIRDYLAGRGIPSQVMKIGTPPNQRLFVWSRVGYADHTSPTAIQHAKDIETIGKDYFRMHRTYSFQQRKSPDAPLTPLYYRGTGKPKENK